MTLRFNFGDFERAARRMGGLVDQVPFALSQALNDAAEIARKDLIETTWPRSIQARDPNFLKAALSTKGTRATKKRLQVTVYDKLGRASLMDHAQGGVKTSKSGNLAIPSLLVKVKRRAKGVPKGLRPRALPNSFVKGDEIYQRTGKDGKNLKLMYTLRPSATIKADVPFQEDFEHSMRREIGRAFAPRLRAAMQSRQKRG